MREYSSAVVVVDGRVIALTGHVEHELLRAALAVAAERERREVARQAETAATVTFQADASAAADLIRLYGRANGSDFDRDLFELEEQLARRPVFAEAPPPLVQRPRPRPRMPRSTAAARRLSWLVEGRAR